jgi:hypothetical protein
MRAMSVARLFQAHLWLRVCLVFVAAWTFLYQLQFQTEWLLAYDGWYHIKYAEMLPSFGIQTEWKWAAQSVWAEHFADKQILYHVFLIPFTWFDNLATGMKHATVLLGAGAVTSFFAVLSLNRFRFPMLWAAVLLAASGEYFLYRLSMPRPQVVSIILLLWSLHFLLNHKRKALAVIIFIYSLSYAAFHVPFGLAIILSVHIFFSERRVEWKTPAVVFVAMLAGMFINPYFPENFRWFWMVNVMIPWTAANTALDLQMADELLPPITRDFLYAHMLSLLAVAAAAWAGMSRKVAFGEKTRALLPILGVYLLLTSMNRRFVEYSVPVGLFFVAAFVTDIFRDVDFGDRWRQGGRDRKILVASGLFAMTVFGGMAYTTYTGIQPRLWLSAPERKGAALYLNEHTEDDELVFTCDWDDAPELFFFNTKNRYPVIMDPFYMYVHDPELWHQWSTAANGRYVGRTYDILAPMYRYGVCTQGWTEIKAIVQKDPRMELVFEDFGAFVFKIDQENPEISLDQLMKMAPGD